MGQKAITDKRYFYFSEVYEKDNMDGILRGAAAQASEESDRFISAAVRSNLFRNVDPHGLGMDLAARNIQRGRDHGLAPFATYREQVLELERKVHTKVRNHGRFGLHSVLKLV